MLLEAFGELCVCDLTAAVGLPQAVVSRQLAMMRTAGLVVARKQGIWVYYRRHPQLAPWVAAVISALAKGPGERVFVDDAQRLKALRPSGPSRCDSDDR